jgi:hypothetical protein
MTLKELISGLNSGRFNEEEIMLIVGKLAEDAQYKDILLELLVNRAPLLLLPAQILIYGGARLKSVACKCRIIEKNIVPLFNNVFNPNERFTENLTVIGYAACINAQTFEDVVKAGGDIWACIHKLSIATYVKQHYGCDKLVELFYRGLIIPPSKIRHFEATQQQAMLYEFI